MVVSNVFYFHPDPWGNEHQFDEHIFQMGWFNHQLVVFWETFFVGKISKISETHPSEKREMGTPVMTRFFWPSSQDFPLII